MDGGHHPRPYKTTLYWLLLQPDAFAGVQGARSAGSVVLYGCMIATELYSRRRGSAAQLHQEYLTGILDVADTVSIG